MMFRSAMWSNVQSARRRSRTGADRNPRTWRAYLLFLQVALRISISWTLGRSGPALLPRSENRSGGRRRRPRRFRCSENKCARSSRPARVSLEAQRLVEVGTVEEAVLGKDVAHPARHLAADRQAAVSVFHPAPADHYVSVGFAIRRPSRLRPALRAMQSSPVSKLQFSIRTSVQESGSQPSLLGPWPWMWTFRIVTLLHNRGLTSNIGESPTVTPSSRMFFERKARTDWAAGSVPLRRRAFRWAHPWRPSQTARFARRPAWERRGATRNSLWPSTATNVRSRPGRRERRRRSPPGSLPRRRRSGANNSGTRFLPIGCRQRAGSAGGSRLNFSVAPSGTCKSTLLLSRIGPVKKTPAGNTTRPPPARVHSATARASPRCSRSFRRPQPRNGLPRSPALEYGRLDASQNAVCLVPSRCMRRLRQPSGRGQPSGPSEKRASARSAIANQERGPLDETR